MEFEDLNNGKLDLAVSFQRTGSFPIDKSQIFSSYEDAIAYVKHDGSDSRKLGKSSHPGQFIAVYENNKACAYFVVNVGDNASLMKLVQVDASYDVEKDINDLSIGLSALEERLLLLENAPKVVDTNTTYTFDTAVEKQGAIRYTATDTNGNTSSGEVQVSGWQSLISIASGRNEVYVYDNKNDSKYLIDTKTEDFYRVGDFLYYRDVNIQDEWISGVLESPDENGCYYEFSPLEFEHPNLNGYLTDVNADLFYVKKVDLKALQNALNTKIDTNTKLIGQNATREELGVLNDNLQNIQSQLNSLDIEKQIQDKVSEISCEQTENEEESYIKSLKQIDGKVIATSGKLHNYTNDINKVAEKTLEEANKRQEQSANILTEKLDKDIASVKIIIEELRDYLNTVKESLCGDVQMTNQQLKDSISTNKQNNEQFGRRIDSISETVTSNASSVNNAVELANKFQSTLIALNNRIINIDSKLSEINIRAERNLIESVSVNGVEQQIDDSKNINITNISTDTLSQGDSILILNGNSWR